MAEGKEPKLYKLFEVGYVKEALAEYVWRVPVACIFSAALSILIVLNDDTDRDMFLICWCGLMIIQLLLLRELLKRKTIFGVNQYLFLLILSGIGWWILVASFYQGPPLVIQLLFYLIIISYGSIALPRLYDHLFFIILLLIGIYQVPVVRGLNAFLCFSLFFMLIASRSSAISYLTLVVRAATETISRYSDFVQLDDTSIQALAWQLAHSVESQRALLVRASGAAMIIKGRQNWESNVDDVFVRGLLQRIDDLGQSAGILRNTELGKQFNRSLKEWFSYVPSGLYFACFNTIIEQQEEEVSVFVPVSLCAKLVGINRTFRGFARIMLIFRTTLEATRTRSVTSDVLFNTQRTISEKEHELNEMVHDINNIVQDMVITCERLREKSAGLENRQNETQQTATELQLGLNGIERFLNILSARVTDTKLLKELVRLKTMMTFETLSVNSLVAEVSVYAAYLAEHNSKKLKIDNSTDPDSRIKVASGEYLKTTLRGLFSVFCKSMTSTELRFSVYTEKSRVIFEIADDRNTSEVIRINEIVGREIDVERGNRQDHCFIAAANLAEVSGGKFSAMPAEEQIPFNITLQLPAGNLEDKSCSSSGYWALLVDDSPEAVTLYSRIVQALNLNFFTAASVPEAKEILDQQGQPRLVITDIKLEKSSGVELLDSIRERFGPELPVIVVSGALEEEDARQMRSAGMVTIIGKPVGRRRLFAEIKNILDR